MLRCSCATLFPNAAICRLRLALQRGRLVSPRPRSSRQRVQRRIGVADQVRDDSNKEPRVVAVSIRVIPRVAAASRCWAAFPAWRGRAVSRPGRSRGGAGHAHVRTNKKTHTWAAGRRPCDDALSLSSSPRPDVPRTLDDDQAACVSGRTSRAEQPGTATGSNDSTPLPS